MADFVPSPQQQAVFDFAANGSGSAIVEAVAGSGKTTTLLHMLALLKGSVALCAYNKKIADEIKDRMGQMGIGNNVKAGTFHSFGYGAMLKAFGKVPLNDKKMADLCVQNNVPADMHKFVCKAVSLAKQAGIGFLCPFDDLGAWNHMVDHFDLEEELPEGNGPLDMDDQISTALDWSIRMLRASVAADPKVIDFDDMIYGPLIHDLRLWQQDWVLIDEAQDTNASRRALAKKMLRPGGRLVAVGDRHQAIYGFTGANHDSLDIIAREFNCQYLPLTITYRCPKTVVTHAQQWVHHIQAATTAPDGTVRTMTEPEFRKLGPEVLGPESAVLCRNTKPLVSLAFHFIRQGIPCHVEGKEIGKGLLLLVNKWKSVRDLPGLRDKLDEYLDRERQRLMAKGQEQKAEALADRVETLFVIMEACGTLGELRERLNTMFDDTFGKPRRLTLSTIHKAKGREWDRVYWFGRNLYQPSKYARQDWQMDQETNLMYVAATRAKNELVEVVAL